MPYIDSAMLETLAAQAEAHSVSSSRSCKVVENDYAPYSDEDPCQTLAASSLKTHVSAFERIVKLVSVRERCSSELRSRLLREDYPVDQVDDAMERAVECSLVDDARFADVLIRTRLGQGRGCRGIEEELKRLNISPSAVEGWPEDYLDQDDATEYDRASEFLQRHPPRSKNIRQSAYRKLVSKGFDVSVAAKAASDYHALVMRDQ